MDNFEKNELVGQYLAQHPDHSDRQVASALGFSPTLVGKVRRYLEAKGRLPKVEKRQGKDGRRRGRRRTAEELQAEMEEQRTREMAERQKAERLEMERLEMERLEMERLEMLFEDVKKHWETDTPEQRIARMRKKSL